MKKFVIYMIVLAATFVACTKKEEEVIEPEPVVKPAPEVNVEMVVKKYAELKAMYASLCKKALGHTYDAKLAKCVPILRKEGRRAREIMNKVKR